jgi:hypothetical protein
MPAPHVSGQCEITKTDLTFCIMSDLLMGLDASANRTITIHEVMILSPSRISFQPQVEIPFLKQYLHAAAP